MMQLTALKIILKNRMYNVINFCFFFPHSHHTAGSRTPTPEWDEAHWGRDEEQGQSGEREPGHHSRADSPESPGEPPDSAGVHQVGVLSSGRVQCCGQSWYCAVLMIKICWGQTGQCAWIRHNHGLWSVFHPWQMPVDISFFPQNSPISAKILNWVLYAIEKNTSRAFQRC